MNLLLPRKSKTGKSQEKVSKQRNFALSFQWKNNISPVKNASEFP